MIHARKDYDRIQDPAGLIPADEPVFLLRANDKFAITAILAWATAASSNSADSTIVMSAIAQIERMARWQTANGCKVPDMPADAVRK